VTGAVGPTTRFVREGGIARVLMPLGRMMKWYHRARAFGVEQIPSDRPVIYVGKHPRTFLYLETVMLALYAFWDSDRPPFRVLEQSDTQVHRAPVLGWMRRHTNAIPATEEHALDALAHSESVLIFPGGTRELYGRPNELRWSGRAGFARIAMKAGVPVLPFAIAGADRQHLGRIRVGRSSIWLPPFPLPVTLHFRFGAPIAPPPNGASADDVAAFAARVEAATRELIA